MSTDLEQIPSGYNALAPEVRERWGVEVVQTIRNTVGKDLSVAEFQMGMAMAGKYGLDPLAHEIWFAKDKNGRVLIMTARDGYLAVARRTPGYKGMDCDVVREKDEFRVERQPDGERLVKHAYSGSDVARGPIQGAWAIVYFEGKVPFYFYAPLVEYRPRSESALKYSPWGTQESVMILKCAQAYALRIASGISGLVSEEEYARVADAASDLGASDGSGAVPDVEFPPAVIAVMERANRLGHAAYSNKASIGLTIGGRTPEAVQAWVDTATAVLDVLEAQEREVTDAEVVSAAEVEVEPVAPEEPAESVAAPTELAPMELDIKRRRLSALYDLQAEAEAAQDEAAMHTLDSEIGQLEDELQAAGQDLAGDVAPGQASLDV